MNNSDVVRFVVAWSRYPGHQANSCQSYSRPFHLATIDVEVSHLQYKLVRVPIVHAFILRNVESGEVALDGAPEWCQFDSLVNKKNAGHYFVLVAWNMFRVQRKHWD
ncbi:hypothetical protein M404DRAFT_749385 [Pisolithus tinctorius Marx 270]|uniref:Uncharacterized protein n=1 Tax=Pisolithus tinctorius Marx 270 TaxID=870435 RepID=A0A0C3KRJ2_PISTI|nr:hypothetical protein M404DRAFT_749385 [Pisolithus tinctorius Marx 270]